MEIPPVPVALSLAIGRVHDGERDRLTESTWHDHDSWPHTTSPLHAGPGCCSRRRRGGSGGTIGGRPVERLGAFEHASELPQSPEDEGQQIQGVVGTGSGPRGHGLD